MIANSKPWIATIYFYLICAVCLITLIFALTTGLMVVFSLIDPESHLDKYEWRSYADLDEFKRSVPDAGPYRTKAVAPVASDTSVAAPVVSDAEWQRRWEAYRSVVIRGELVSAKRNLVNQLIIIIVTLPIFLIHWRFARRIGRNDRKSGDNSVDTAALES